jgi:hypothetical protein
MKSALKFILLFKLMLFFFTANTQSISGTWKGNYSKSHILFNTTSVVVEINITNDSIITGLSHLYYSNNRYEHHKIEGKFNAKDSTITFDESFISTNIVFANIYEARYKMKLKDLGTKLRMEGKWKGVKSIFGYLPYHKVWLEKEKDTVAKVKQPVPTDSTQLVNNKSVQQLARVTDVQKLIEVAKAEKDSIKFSVYDNGEVDGDSISIYVGDQLIISNQKISTKPIVFYLSLSEKDKMQKVKLIAENMGSIPPNTALLIIETTTKKRYEVNLSSNFEKNASIEFFLTE